MNELQALAQEAKRASDELIAAQRDKENLLTNRQEIIDELATKGLATETLDGKIEELQSTVTSLTTQARQLLRPPEVN